MNFFLSWGIEDNCRANWWQEGCDSICVDGNGDGGHGWEKMEDIDLFWEHLENKDFMSVPEKYQVLMSAATQKWGFGSHKKVFVSSEPCFGFRLTVCFSSWAFPFSVPKEKQL